MSIDVSCSLLVYSIREQLQLFIHKIKQLVISIETVSCIHNQAAKSVIDMEVASQDWIGSRVSVVVVVNQNRTNVHDHSRQVHPTHLVVVTNEATDQGTHQS